MNRTRERARLDTLKKRALRIDNGSEDELKALARSWLANPIHDILVRASDRAIADGTRRVTGLELLGETEAEIVMLDGDPTDSDLDIMAMVSAFHRLPLGGFEQASIVRSIKAARPGVTNQAIADEMQIDGSMPTRLLSLFDCPPEVQEAAKAGRIGVTKWYAISQSPDPLADLQDALNGSSRADLERKNRKRKDGGSKAATVKTRSLPVVLASGITATFQAEGVTLHMALEALPEIKKELDDAIKKEHDARTLAALMKKRAKQFKGMAKAGS